MDEVITYTIVAVNSGERVTDVVLSDPVPNGAAFVPNSCTYWGPAGERSCGPPPDLWTENFDTGTRITTTFAVEVTAGTMGWPIVNCATLDWDTDQKEMCTTTTMRAFVYLPFVARNFVAAPDLVVSDVITNGADPEVVIANQGNAPVEDAFWVDLYVNPDPAPEIVNDIWEDLCDEGIAWGVTEPLDVGESLTLTVDGPYYSEQFSDFTEPLSPGDRIYVHVDSASAGRDYGGVSEDHEILGGDYNNIWPTYDAGALSTTASSRAGEQSLDQMPSRP